MKQEEEKRKIKLFVILLSPLYDDDDDDDDYGVIVNWKLTHMFQKVNYFTMCVCMNRSCWMLSDLIKNYIHIFLLFRYIFTKNSKIYSIYIYYKLKLYRIVINMRMRIS